MIIARTIWLIKAWEKQNKQKFICLNWVMLPMAMLMLLVMLPFSHAIANDDAVNWSVKGFGTFALTGTDTREIGYKRDLSQVKNVKKPWGFLTDSRFGIQLDVDINQSLHATTQWVVRDHAGNFFEQNLEWAFLRWSQSDTLDIRFGRMGADLFLLSDYRNVGYAYPWMRPPHEFYASVPMFHFDGFDIKKNFRIDDDLLSLKLFAGYSFNQLPTVFPELFEVESPVAGGNIVYQSGNWTTRAAYAFLHILSDVPVGQLTDVLLQPETNFAIPNISQVVPHLSIKNTDIHYMSVGTAYDDSTWFAQAEASYIESETSYYPPSANAYLSVGRRFSTLSIYALYGISQTFRNSVDIPQPLVPAPELLQLTNVVDDVINRNEVDEQSISLGLRWDFHPKVALKAQWIHYWLGDNGAALWQKANAQDIPDQVNVWSVGIDFIY